MAGTVSAREWARRFAERRRFARHGSHDVDLPGLSAGETADLMSSTGIHEGVLGPLRRAAHKLNWFVFVRPVKVSAMFHCGDFDKLPKPMGIKAKCHPVTGMVMLEGDEDFRRALSDGRIDPGYASIHGLHLDPTPVAVPGSARPLHYLVNRRGQRYYSDMDLYEVLDADTGRRVVLGTGDPSRPHSGVNRRRELDILINVLRPLGTDFALIDHGPQRQWVKHDHGTPWSEPITVFCPDGSVFVLPPGEVDSFIGQLTR
jgi:hypothetical protein